MNIDFVVMGHESRREYFDSLYQVIGPAYSSIDDGTLGVWGNAKRAWGNVLTECDYGVVIQDDAILCDHFKLKANAFLHQHNGHVVSFYFGDDIRKRKWVKPEYFDAPLYHAVALAIPTPLIPGMIEHCDKQTNAIGDDMRMKRWLISQNMTCRYSNPSLVQHRDIPSIVNPDKPVRQSAIFQQ